MSLLSRLARPEWQTTAVPSQVPRPSALTHAALALLVPLFFGLLWGIPLTMHGGALGAAAASFVVIVLGIIVSVALPWPHGFSPRVTASVGASIGLALALQCSLLLPAFPGVAVVPIVAVGALLGRVSDIACAECQRRRLARWREARDLVPSVPATACDEQRRLDDAWRHMARIEVRAIAVVAIGSGAAMLVALLTPAALGMPLLLFVGLSLLAVMRVQAAVAYDAVALEQAATRRPDSVGPLLDRARTIGQPYRMWSESGPIVRLLDLSGAEVIDTLSARQLRTLASILQRTSPRVRSQSQWASDALRTLDCVARYSDRDRRLLGRRLARSRVGRRLGPITRQAIRGGA
ncbi:MAG: hypothetical protein KGJ62_08210 [Armatimonadetes bacterium]|nr:hypothetical protein [Armatimonadota bacterium]MDE2205260.1 hypothetical protein [Armatimonadota bacterium]